MKITRKAIAMLVAEFLGTALLALVVLAISKSSLAIPYFIGMGAGLTVIMAGLVLGGVSGAHLNPIITLGLWSVRRVKTLPALAYIAAQLAGGFSAYYLFTYLIGQQLPAQELQFESKVLVAEAVGAFIFSLGWAAAVYQRMEAPKAAAVVGISLMLGVLVSFVGAGGIINPAVALGLKSWVWGTYVLGPVLGAIIGFNLYGLLFAPVKEFADEAAPATSKKK